MLVFVSFEKRLILLLLRLSSFAFAYRFADHILDEDDEIDGALHHQPVTHLADVPPPTARSECYGDDWNRSDGFLSRHWDENAGFSKNKSGDADEEHALTYGEVTSLGVRQLAYEMGIATMEECSVMTHTNHNTNDVVFYDLGSGVGRLVTQMYFDQSKRIRKAVGVELALDRHEIARQALADIHSMEQPLNKKNECMPNSENLNDEDTTLSLPIVVLHGDALQVDWSDATHVFMSSLCFPDHVLESLQRVALTLPNLQVVAALNRLDVVRRHNDSWEEQEVHIQMSWGPGVAKVYRRRLAA
jgi:hypothetical protein